MQEILKYPLVSFISINYNQSAVTLEFLESVSKITYPNIEIIIVDNASPSDDPSIITEKFPNVKLIRSAENLGFSGGNNLGIVHSKGEYLLFINNDTEVEPNFLEPLVNAFENDDNLGMVSPKIYFYHQKENKVMQYAGGESVDYKKGVGYFIGYGEKDTNQYSTSDTKLIHGAAVMVPRKLMKTIGVWPDVYFLYYEEIDWSEHFRKAGYKLRYISESIVYHKESISIGKATPIRIYYMNRNRQLFIRRNAPIKQKIQSLLFFYVASLPKSTLSFLFNGKWNLLVALWKGVFWNLFHWVNLKKTPVLQVKGSKEKIINGLYNYQ